MISTAILETMWVWNDYLLPTLVLDIKKYRTIPMAIQYFRGGYGRVELAPHDGLHHHRHHPHHHPLHDLPEVHHRGCRGRRCQGLKQGGSSHACKRHSMPVFSLPGPYGIGTLGDEAFAFVDFLAAAKQTYWQILPIGPTGYGDSPYQSFSAFAGNPYFIDFRLLAADGLLTEAELPASQPVGPVDYGALYQQRPVVLHKAADRLLASPTPAYEAFCEAQSGWLEDYALFMAVKAERGQAGLADWPDDLRTRKPAVLAAAKERLAAEVDYYKAVQFFFYTQWNALKTYANSHGIQLVGDIPIYVSPDSSDLWTHRSCSRPTAPST